MASMSSVPSATMPPPHLDDSPWVGRTGSIGFQVNYLARLMAQLLQDAIEPLGVVPGQMAQLLVLYDRDGRTPTELSRAVGVEPGTMSKTLHRMERDGLVERRPARNDGRSVTIHLSERSRRLEPLLKSAATDVNGRLTAAIPEGQLSTFMLVLETLAREASELLAASRDPRTRTAADG